MDRLFDRPSSLVTRLVSPIALGVVVAAITVLSPAAARAGDCPECTSSADCGGAGHFCVLHDGPVGCGDRVQLCCPGQACAVRDDGRPSCESEGTCTVVEGSTPPPDAGPTTSDSGPPSGTDSGTPRVDSGAGGGGDTEDDGGCDCRIAGHGDSPNGGAFAFAGLTAFAWIARRRRAQRPPPA